MRHGGNETLNPATDDLPPLSPAALFGGFGITTMNTKNEIVTLSLSVRLEYETEAGREYLIRRLGEEVAIDMGGGGDVGFYSMKSVDGTARVKPNASDQATARK